MRIKLLSLCATIWVMASFLLALPALAETLSGGVQHQESLQPLAPEFQIGATFQEPTPAVRIEWFPIPPWMAGTWTKQGDIETFAQNLRNGEQTNQQIFMPNVVTLTFGHQPDAHGTIWHAEVLPFRADGVRGKSEDHRFVNDERCLQTTAAATVLQVRSTIVTVDMKNQKVKRSKQQEEIITFTPVDAGNMLTQSSTRSFDAQGLPMFQSQSHTDRRKVAEFAPVPYLNGIDLRQSLAQYLTAHNMAYLVPR